jgi:hypothetical protein
MWDASTSGTYLGKDQLATTQAMSVGETFRMRVGDIDLGIA